jgi:hypothetical protein
MAWATFWAIFSQTHLVALMSGQFNNRDFPRSFIWGGQKVYNIGFQNMADSWSSVNTPERSLANKVTAWYDEVRNQFLFSVKLYMYLPTYLPT